MPLDFSNVNLELLPDKPLNFDLVDLSLLPDQTDPTPLERGLGVIFPPHIPSERRPSVPGDPFISQMSYAGTGETRREAPGPSGIPQMAKDVVGSISPYIQGVGNMFQQAPLTANLYDEAMVALDFPRQAIKQFGFDPYYATWKGMEAIGIVDEGYADTQVKRVEQAKESVFKDDTIPFPDINIGGVNIMSPMKMKTFYENLGNSAGIMAGYGAVGGMASNATAKIVNPIFKAMLRGGITGAVIENFKNIFEGEGLKKQGTDIVIGAATLAAISGGFAAIPVGSRSVGRWLAKGPGGRNWDKFVRVSSKHLTQELNAMGYPADLNGSKKFMQQWLYGMSKFKPEGKFSVKELKAAVKTVKSGISMLDAIKKSFGKGGIPRVSPLRTGLPGGQAVPGALVTTPGIPVKAPIRPVTPSTRGIPTRVAPKPSGIPTKPGEGGVIEQIKLSIKDRGVKGDKLLDAEDLVDEVLAYDKTVEIDEKGFITLYHRTTPENAKAIISSGKMKKKEQDLFFGTKPDGQISGYGDAVIKVKVPIESTKINDIFTEEVHLTIPGKDLKDVTIQATITEGRLATEALKEQLFYKSKEVAPQLGGQFAQNIEPAGNYINFASAKDISGISKEHFTTGKIQFQNPLIIEWETSGKGGWKTKLSKRYGNKTGAELSKAIVDDGYDAIITTDKTGFKEVVDLKRIYNQAKEAQDALQISKAKEVSARKEAEISKEVGQEIREKDQAEALGKAPPAVEPGIPLTKAPAGIPKEMTRKEAIQILSKGKGATGYSEAYKALRKHNLRALSDVPPKPTGIPQKEEIFYHRTQKGVSFDKLQVGKDGGIHIGTAPQAKMRGLGKTISGRLDTDNFSKSKDTGGNWKSKIKSAKQKGYNGIKYLNRYEGIQTDSILKAQKAGYSGDALDKLTDKKFKTLFPEAEYSYIIFDPKDFKIIKPTVQARGIPQKEGVPEGDVYTNEIIDYNGVPVSRDMVMQDLMKQGLSDNMIQAYMDGAKVLNTRLSPLGQMQAEGVGGFVNIPQTMQITNADGVQEVIEPSQAAVFPLGKGRYLVKDGHPVEVSKKGIHEMKLKGAVFSDEANIGGGGLGPREKGLVKVTPKQQDIHVPEAFHSTAPAFNDHVNYFSSLQISPNSPVRKIQKRMQVVNGKRLSGKFTADEANKKIIALKWQLMKAAGKEGIAVRMTPGGKVMLALRDAGTFVPVEFAEYDKFKDVRNILGGGSDITRAVQNIDGARTVKEKLNLKGQAGPAERLVLWRTRDMMLQKIRYIDQKGAKLLLINQMTKAKPGSKTDTLVNDILREITNENSWMTPESLIRNNEKIRALSVNPNVVGQAVELRKFYDEIINEQNALREMRGQDPIPYRGTYSPEILRDATLWEKMMNQNFSSEQVSKGDLPDYIKPNKPFNPRELAREHGIPYELRVKSSIELAERYIATAAKDIFNTSIIQNNKAFIQQLETMGLNGSAQVLSDWTSRAYGGVKPPLDRTLRLPRWGEKALNKFNRVRNLAVFPLNLAWSMTTQPSSMALTVGRFGAIRTLQGLYNWISNPKLRKEVSEEYYSYIIKAQKGGRLSRQDASNLVGQKVKVYKSTLDIVNDALTIVLDQEEKLLTGASIEAGRLWGKKRGLTGDALKHFASDAGTKTQSDYSDEGKPPILTNLLVKSITPYQTFAFELVNTFREWFGYTGTPPDTKMDRMWTILRFIAAAAVFQAIARMVAKKDVYSWKNPPLPFAEYWWTPIASSIAGDGWQVGSSRNLPSPVLTAKKIGDGIKLFVDKGDSRKLRNELLKYGPGFFGVGGGGQISRTVDAIWGYAEGGIYDKNGKRMFVINEQNLPRSIFSGVWSTEGGQKRLGK